MSDQVCSVIQIKHAVCAEFNVPLRDMVSSLRFKNIVRSRMTAMFLSRKLTPRTTTEIGTHFGGRDHSTVCHAIERINELMAADPEFALRVTAIEARLTATQNGEHY